ncbi:MAG: alpha/beta hydrolase domain-containing protein [Gammaproteobacteria bacterium]|nr:alpha/beta hydrolase domain-containing protein [Gammaproteobacteria bacterium]
MTAESFEVTERRPYAGGRLFGEFGPFEISQGRIHYAVDPESPRNAAVVDLAHAPRDDDGKVRFQGEFTFIHTVAGGAGKPARTLLIDVPNRGRRLSFSMFNRARPEDLQGDPCAPGDGFLFERGFAVASIGWQWGVAGGLGLAPPEALVDGAPVTGDVVCRVQPGSDRPFVSFGQLGEVAYPPASFSDEGKPLAHPRAEGSSDEGKPLAHARPCGRVGSSASAELLVPRAEGSSDDAGDRLFERPHDNAPQVKLPRSAWRFARLRDGELTPSAKHIHLDGGFRAGRIYTLVYRARGAPIVGCGLLALRDAAAALRAGAFSEGPPRASGAFSDGFDRVLAFGASQTGRVLRHLLHAGLNVGEDGEPVFDGVHAHIAGGQRGDFNHRFAQPAAAGVPGPGQQFPFAGVRHADPIGGTTDGLYERLEHMPKVMLTNTSWEYWRGDAALTHVSPDGQRDLASHPDERNYLLAGTQHTNGTLPRTNTFAVSGELARYPFNVVDHGPLVRAALVNLERWSRGIAPPESRVPTLRSGTLVERGAVLAKFARQAGLATLDADELGGLAHLRLGTSAAQGICAFPAVESGAYARLVADVDDTLNEVAGIRLPDIEVPLGCHTGWNPRHPDHGAPTQAAMFVGFSLFRPIEISRATYEARVRKVAERLARQRYLLEEDVDLVVANCLGRYDTAAETPADLPSMTA